MDRPSFGAAAFAATALLVIASTDARADSGATPPEVVPTTEQVTVTGGVTAVQATAGGGGVQDVPQAGDSGLAAETVSAPDPVVSSAASNPQPTQATEPTVTSEQASNGPDPATPPAGAIDESPPAPPEPRSEADSAPPADERSASSSGDRSPSGASPPVRGTPPEAPATEAATSSTPPPAPSKTTPVRAGPATRQTGARGKSPDRVVVAEKRRLRRVKGQVDALKRELTTGAYTHSRAPSAAVPPARAAAASPERGNDHRRRTGPREPEAPGAPAPSSPAPGSATASPGGGLVAAGMAVAVALLAALALPRLRVRVDLQAARCRTTAFLVPLERPG
jgi:hypothetical protein